RNGRRRDRRRRRGQERVVSLRQKNQVGEVHISVRVVVEIAQGKVSAALAVILGQDDQIGEVDVPVVIGVRRQNEEVEREIRGDGISRGVGDAPRRESHLVVSVRQQRCEGKLVQPRAEEELHRNLRGGNAAAGGQVPNRQVRSVQRVMHV